MAGETERDDTFTELHSKMTGNIERDDALHERFTELHFKLTEDIERDNTLPNSRSCIAR